MLDSMLENKGTQILAKSLFRELRGHGYSPHHILGITTELIELVTEDLRERNAAAAVQRDGQAGQEQQASA